MCHIYDPARKFSEKLHDRVAETHEKRKTSKFTLFPQKTYAYTA